MRKIRIGNDIEVTWEVKTGGEVLSLEGRSLRVYVRSAYSREEITDFTVEGCVLRFSYPAAMQKVTGARAVELVDTTNGVRTVCADLAFQLVGHTSEEDGCASAAVETAAHEDFGKYLVELKSNVLVGRPGMSAYEIWKGLGNTGSEEDFIASLKGEKGDKGDDFNGKVSMEQLPEDVRKTVQRVKKREVRYIPFKAINMNSVNDGRYENRYVYNNYDNIPLYIEKNVKRIRISMGGATVEELSFDRQNHRNGAIDNLNITVEKDGDDFVLSEHKDYRLCCNVILDMQNPEDGNTTHAFKPVSYSVDDEGLAVIEIEPIEINDSVKLSRMDYRLLNGNIKYTGVVPKPMLGSIINLTPKGMERDSNLRNIYKAVLTCNRLVRKGKSKRVKDAEDKNLYLNIKGQTISRKKKMYQENFPFSKGVCRFTLAALKRDRFKHKSILGFKEYKVVTLNYRNKVLKVE